MLTYLIRRYLLTLLLAPLLLYSIILYCPGGVLSYLHTLNAINPPNAPYKDLSQLSTQELERIIKSPSFDNSMNYTFHLNDPWPRNYTTWLFNPQERWKYDSINDELVPSSIDLFGISIPGSGALTGDFGPSIGVARAVPVSDLLGGGLTGLFLVLIIPIFILASLNTILRVKRGYKNPIQARAMPVDHDTAPYGSMLLWR